MISKKDNQKKNQYNKRKIALLNSKNVCKENKELFEKTLNYYELRLKRRNDISELDESSYKTMGYYISRLIALNKWFEKIAFKDLPEEKIIKVIDDLEDGVIKNKFGKRFHDRSLYYQMMMGRLFELVDKDKIVKNYLKEFAIIGRKDKDIVKYIEQNIEENFRKLVDVAVDVHHKLLLWLAFDIGENIGSLLVLKRKDCSRQINQETKEPEYLIRLDSEILKRSRKARTEPTLYNETCKLLDIVLNSKKEVILRNEKGEPLRDKYGKLIKTQIDFQPDDYIFDFGNQGADRLLERAVKKAGVKCNDGSIVTWKTLRSSMASSLLLKNWSIEDINRRMGHSLTSQVLKKYIDHFALDKTSSKKKNHEFNIDRLDEQLEQSKQSNKLQAMKIEELKRLDEEKEKSIEELNRKYNEQQIIINGLLHLVKPIKENGDEQR